MLVEFTKHCDTSEGRQKIGNVIALPSNEAKELIAAGKCKALEWTVEEVAEELNLSEVDDGSRDE